MPKMPRDKLAHPQYQFSPHHAHQRQYRGCNHTRLRVADRADAARADLRSAGVAVAGALLRLTSLGHGGVQTVADFHITIVVIAVLAVVATVDFFKVPANAGEGLR
jgi:hypothetical protein